MRSPIRRLQEPPQWGAADAEIKVPSVENTELEGSPFKACGRSVCSHTCHAYSQGFCLFLRVYSPSTQLRSSSDSRTLRIPHIKTGTLGHRSFSHAVPSVWNSLPHDIRHIQSVTAFKTALKTHLFKSYLC